MFAEIACGGISTRKKSALRAPAGASGAAWPARLAISTLPLTPVCIINYVDRARAIMTDVRSLHETPCIRTSRCVTKCSRTRNSKCSSVSFREISFDPERARVTTNERTSNASARVSLQKITMLLHGLRGMTYPLHLSRVTSTLIHETGAFSLNPVEDCLVMLRARRRRRGACRRDTFVSIKAHTTDIFAGRLIDNSPLQEDTNAICNVVSRVVRIQSR